MHKRGIVGYSKKSALLEEAITHMNTGKYGRSSAALKELLALDPQNIEARRLFATLHLRLGSLVTARQAFESLANEAIGRQDYWLAESLLGEYLAAGPRCVPFLEQLAHVHQEKGDEMAAVTELGKAIEILRDDPDPDNPQKAAQLYAKIRELAPASSVALQLATLFDVQTGEFLGRPSGSSTTPLDDDAGTNEAIPPAEAGFVQAVAEHPLPEVMPWEMTDESAASEPEVESPTPAEFVEVEELPPTIESVDVQPAIEPLPDQPVEPEPALEETSYSFRMVEDAPLESSPNESLSELATNESPSEASSGIPSPMPWEQMADASVQIVEPEVAPTSDPSPSLESLLTTLRTEEEVVSPAPAIPKALPAAPAENAQASEPMQSEAGSAGSAPLSAPMPWEQISDPAIQISVAEPSPLAPEEFLPVAPVASAESSMPMPVAEVTLVSQATLTEPAVPATESISLAEPSTASSVDIPTATSFSWNSVFDKAWKITAGTMAPSPTAPSENGLEETPESAAVEPSIQSAPTAHEEVSCFTPAVESPPTPAETSPPSVSSSHWNTGEVAVQVHRPSKKKKRWEKGSEEESPPSASEDTVREWKSTTEEAAPRAEEVTSPPVEVRPEWMRATESITISRPEHPTTQARWSDAETAPSIGEPASAAAVSAVDTLFSPSATVDDLHPHLSWSKPRPRLMARFHRVRIGISSFVGSCFSTTRSLSFLAVMITIAVVVVSGAGAAAVGVMWMTMEDGPSPVYQALTISPPRTITDAKKNGYLLLLGIDAPAGQDSVQAGYERKAQPESDRAAARVCMGGDGDKSFPGTGGAYDQLLREWVRIGDPLAPLKGQGAALKAVTARESTALARYQQWLTMPFDDWGFGQSLSPNCTHVLLVHRLFVLDGFNQDIASGLDRLEADLQAWRGALGQSKTLPMKMLAVTAVQDDASLVSGLLSRTDLDGPAMARLSKMVRPLDQTELSVRWPMQSQFVWATRSVQQELKEDKAQDRPWHVSLATAMRLPVQRRANAYADYYDAANKAVAAGRYTNLPKLSTFVRTPASGLTDYLVNPIEHIVGVEPLPSWDSYVLRMIETDAQLRLAGLQAWLRRGPQDGDVLTRLAKAGQAYYDPFTGLPMLVNQRKGVLYSVGRDGKDQEGDDVRDVTALIPFSGSDSRRSAVSASLR